MQNGQQTVADYASGAVSTSPTYSYYYASYIDEPVMRAGGSGERYFHRNQQYSIVALTDSTGSIKERYSYDAYGTLTIGDSSGVVRTGSDEGNRYTYTGRESDSDLELYHFRARMYNAGSGRFLGRDPVGYLASKGLYTGTFPLSHTDASGLWDLLGIFSHDFDYDECRIQLGVLAQQQRFPRRPGDWRVEKSYDWLRAWLSATRCLIPGDVHGTGCGNVYRGCVGITETLIGKRLSFQAGHFSDCFETWHQAEAFRKTLPPGSCKGKNTCGKPAEPVIFGVTWHTTNMRIATTRMRIERKWGIKMYPWIHELVVFQLLMRFYRPYEEIVGGRIIWNDDSIEALNEAFPFDFGYWHPSLHVMIHANYAERRKNGPKLPKARVYFSDRKGYEIYEQRSPSFKTFYCVTCEADHFK